MNKQRGGKYKKGIKLLVIVLHFNFFYFHIFPLKIIHFIFNALQFRKHSWWVPPSKQNSVAQSDRLSLKVQYMMIPTAL